MGKSKTEYYSCPFMNAGGLYFFGHMSGDRFVSVCCEGANIKDVPGVALGTAKETIENFLEMREAVIVEGHLPAEQRMFSKNCEKCSFYKLDYWDDRSDLITVVNFSMYPSPCQLKCNYCLFRQLDEDAHSERHFTDCTAVAPSGGQYSIGYENILGAVEYALEKGLISKDAHWVVSCGEIAIHPYKDRILGLVKDNRVTFTTNCVKFDEEIANILSVSPNSNMVVSLDAGTAKTWRDIKGVDNFDRVVDNIAQYSKRSINVGQVSIKYIILPNLNSFLEDYSGVIKIVKSLGLGILYIAGDLRKRHGNITAEEEEEAIISAAYLLAMLGKEGLKAGVIAYSTDQYNAMIDLAQRFKV